MSGLECQIENCYHRNQPEGAIPLKFEEIVRVVKRPSGERTFAEDHFWPKGPRPLTLADSASLVNRADIHNRLPKLLVADWKACNSCINPVGIDSEDKLNHCSVPILSHKGMGKFGESFAGKPTY